MCLLSYYCLLSDSICSYSTRGKIFKLSYYFVSSNPSLLNSYMKTKLPIIYHVIITTLQQRYYFLNNTLKNIRFSFNNCKNKSFIIKIILYSSGEIMRWYPRKPTSPPVHINSYLCPINIAKHQSTNQTKHIETQWRPNDDRNAAKAYQASIKRDRPDCWTHPILTQRPVHKPCTSRPTTNWINLGPPLLHVPYHRVQSEINREKQIEGRMLLR